MAGETIAIIGAGIAGLSAACYAQMNGYQAQVFEMHSLPGGLCTSWSRKGYTFDGCIHHLAGASPASSLYRVWEEMGAVQDREMVFRDHFVQVEDPDGRVFTVHTDLARLEQHMRELAPDDGAVLDDYFRALRALRRVDLLAMPVSGLGEKLALLPALPALIRWGKVTMAEFASRFRDPFLRRAFPVIQYDFADLPMLIHLNFIVGCHNRTLGWPVGGSRSFAQSIADRCERLGAKLHYRSRVVKVLVEEDRAVGIELDDGTQVGADRVISAADGHATIFEMLDGRYANDFIRTYYAEPGDRQDMNFHVSLGLGRDMSGEPNALTLFLERPVELLGRERDRLNLEIFNFDATMAPPGACGVKILLDSSYSFWRELYDDRARYTEEKAAVADRLIELLEPRFPGLREDVEVVDVATPVTIERFTGNWRGMQAGMPEGASMMTMMRGWLPSLPGLDRFHMVGHWAGGIGISTSAVGGRSMIRSICKLDGRRFTASVPS